MSDISEDVRAIGPGIKVAVVDDAEHFLVMAKRALEHSGYEVSTYFSAKEFFDDDPEQYAVAIIDYMMPGMDGIECIGELGKRYPEIPAILVTGYPADYLLAKAWEAGAKDYLEKPVSPESLAESINHAYSLSQKVWN